MSTVRRKLASYTRIPRAVRILVLICLAISGLLALWRFFQVKEIECTLDQQTCPSELITTLHILIGKPLFATDYSHSLYEQDLPFPVKLQAVEKRLPHTVSLTFITEPLAYQLVTPDGVFSVSATGFPFQHTTVSAPVSIVMEQPTAIVLQSPTAIAPEIHTALAALAQALVEHALSTERITWVDKDTIMLIMDDITPTVLIDAHDPVTGIQKLKQIIVTPEYMAIASQVHEIDVRFNLPVLRMKQ